jgi:hypothetical protein
VQAAAGVGLQGADVDHPAVGDGRLDPRGVGVPAGREAAVGEQKEVRRGERVGHRSHQKRK